MSLTPEQIEQIVAVNKAAAPLRRKLKELESSPNNNPDYRQWISVAILRLEEGMNAAERAIENMVANEP